MTNDALRTLFDPEACRELMPSSTADEFFDALFGDADEGSYDIALSYSGADADSLRFNIELHERPGRCLACNLTYGLPEVFSRHPVININGLVERINERLGDQGTGGDWKLGTTVQQSQSLHVIPLTIKRN